MIVLVMGPSGSGKSTVGRVLAERLGWRFIDADDYHPPSNIAKMREGTALADADREPWLVALRREIDGARDGGEPLVLAVSALRRRHRGMLGSELPDVLAVYLDAAGELLLQRVTERVGHFMPPSMVESQLATLEPPLEGERALVLDASERVDALVDRIVERLDLDGPS